nr:hypothetical protein [Enterococcus faecalis]
MILLSLVSIFIIKNKKK